MVNILTLRQNTTAMARGREEEMRCERTQRTDRARKEEIITACAEPYKTMSFKEITLKEIGSATSLTRTSIYNYFQKKEEIFLALLQREYERWNDRLRQIQAEHDPKV